MKISKISQYAKLLVVVLGMAFIAVSCSKDKDNELVGTNWEGDNGMIALYVEFTSNTEAMVRAEFGGTSLFPTKTNYSYNPPRITVTIPEDPILNVIIPKGTQMVGTVSGNTMTFDFNGETFVLTKK